MGKQLKLQNIYYNITLNTAEIGLFYGQMMTTNPRRRNLQQPGESAENSAGNKIVDIGWLQGNEKKKNIWNAQETYNDSKPHNYWH